MKILISLLTFSFLSMFCIAQNTANLYNHSNFGNRTLSAQNANAPFLHGVSSGDPLQDAVIIWTRVTVEDINEAEVTYVVATDVELTDLVDAGSFTTDTERDWTVKIDIVDLDPETTYYYQFSFDGNTSIIGRTRTAAATSEHLRFGVVSCSNYQAGYYNAYKLMANRPDLDAIFHLGDYIYEYEEGGYGWDSLLMRGHEPDHEIITLIDYRTRYSFYKLDQDLQAVHQQHPFIMIWDDHESANDSYKDGAGNHDASEGSWEDRKAAAKQAYFEWNPIRDTDNSTIHRGISYGDLMNVTMLDTRLEGRVLQVEDASATDWADPSRTLLGEDQLTWFKDRLANNTATWHIIGNQVIFSKIYLGTLETLNPAAPGLFMDSWEGYPSERDSVLTFVRDNDIDNVVILTGDFHTSFGLDVPLDSASYDVTTGEGSHMVEFSVPSVTSANFDENLAALGVPSLIAAIEGLFPVFNEHLIYENFVDHGYCILDVRPEAVTTDYFYTDSLFIRTEDETHGGSLVTQNGANHWVPTTQPSTPKSDSPDIAPLGINNNEDSAFQLTALYPNPASNFSILNFNLKRSENVNIDLYSMDSKKVKHLIQEDLTPGFYSLNIPTADLANGVYIIQLESKTGTSHQKLVIKK